MEKNPPLGDRRFWGTGANELIPEAKAMAKYLEIITFPREVILEESDSSSTKENFIFFLIDSFAKHWMINIP